jgi:hypothetical protein
MEFTPHMINEIRKGGTRMKKLLGLLWLIMIPLMVGCVANRETDPTKDYLSQMTELTETEVIEVWESYKTSTYYVTHKLVLNPEETLYYAPKKVQDGENIYLNEQELFFIIAVQPGLFGTTTSKKVTDEELKLIFD